MAKEKAKEEQNNNEPKLEEQNSVQNNNAETNLVKKWTELPANSELNKPKQVQNKQTNLLAANMNTPENSNVKPNEVIPAATLTAETKPEKKLYVPSIFVDNSYILEEENEINKKVSNILKRTDGKINKLSESLRN